MERFISDYTEPDPKEVAYIVDHYDVSPVVAKLLIHRKFNTDLDSFFHTDTYHDPFLLHDMKKAVHVIRKYLASGERITVFGDYDVDGVTASSMLYTFLKEQGGDVDYLLPNRQTDGYGLSLPLIDELLERGTKLIVTVDCGITSIAEAAYCKEKGVDLVVTDHHQVLPNQLPDCCAVVNPLLAGYPYPKLCGAGVAGKLIYALSDLETFSRYLDNMAVATIADLVPLTGENRVIVKNGLQRLNQDTRPCFAALKSVCGIHGPIEVGHVAFGIAPRINAAGRISSAVEGFSLLTETDFDKAMQKSKNLNLINRIRQKQEEEILSAVLETVAQQVDLQKDRVIIVSGQKWNKGVVGIVASKVVEQFHRPAFILSEEDGICTGSGRGVPGVHLFQLIHRFGDMLVKYGGHEMAAGLTIQANRLEAFRQKLNETLTEHYDARCFVPAVRYDMKLSLKDVNMDLIDSLKRMAPMGMGNPTPVFLIENVSLGNAKCIGDTKKHLRFTAIDHKISVNSVAFSMGDSITRIDAAQKYDLIAHVEGNEWNDSVQPQLQVKAFHRNVDQNIQPVVYGDPCGFVASLRTLPNQLSDPMEKDGRLRKMWRGDVYISRRLQKDVLGTAVYSSVPEASLALLAMLKKEKILSSIDVTYRTPNSQSCLVLNPDWTIESMPHQRLVINDYAPAAFIQRMLKENPNLQVVICNNQEREQQIQDYLSRLPVQRETLLGYFSGAKQLVSGKTPNLLREFSHLNQLTPNQARLIMDIFIELGLFEQVDGQFNLCVREGKANLSDSQLFQTISQLDDRMGKELHLLMDAVGK